MKFTVELTPEEVVTVERLQATNFPTASLAEIVRHLLEVAICGEQNIQAMMDNPPPSIFEPLPF